MSSIATLFLNRANPACYEIKALLQFLNVDYRIMDVNPIIHGKEKKLTRNGAVPIIRYDNHSGRYESDPKKVIRYYVEEQGKQSLSNEELKWIDYIHKEVIPSVSLMNSSSIGNLKRLYWCMYDPACTLNMMSKWVGRGIGPYWSRLSLQYDSRKKLGVSYTTSSEHPIAVVGAQIAESIEQANAANIANKDQESVFISGNSKPCLIDILMYGSLSQLKENNNVKALANTISTDWFRTVDDVSELLQIRRRLQY